VCVCQLSQDKENLEIERQSAVSHCEMLSEHLSSVQTELRHKNDLVAKLRRLITHAKLVCVATLIVTVHYHHRHPRHQSIQSINQSVSQSQKHRDMASTVQNNST